MKTTTWGFGTGTCPGRRTWRAAAAWLVLLLGARHGAASTLGQDTVYVDIGNAACRETAAGTLDDPYCSITVALTAHHAPGTVILVRPGTYREQVTLPASGTEGALLSLVAAPADGQPVVIDGADDLSQAGVWQVQSGDVWLARSVDWIPHQVRAHGARLKPWAGPVEAMPADAWAYVLGTGLYVNVGGDPAGRDVHVGRRRYGFYLPNRSYVHIEGFTVIESDDRGIRLNPGSSHDEIVGNTVRWVNGIGIQAVGTTDSKFTGNKVSENSDHGMSLLDASVRNVVQGNESSYNVYPDLRRANGIYLFESPNNLLVANRWHHNQDSGEQIQSNSDSVISVQNLSWSNGDHGFDHLHAIGSVLIGDVAYGNFKDGFSFEGSSSASEVHDCIAIENGITTNEADLWVDDGSIAGLSCDDNIFWNSTSQPPIKRGLSRFVDVTAWSDSTGMDTRTMQADPLFADPANGDFHLKPGSPAIDNANSDTPYWPRLDAQGMARIDDPQVPDGGRGPVAFADRGAYEFLPDVMLAADGSGIDGLRDALEVRPDPVRSAAEIRFGLRHAGALRVAIYDLGGRRVRTLRGGMAGPGEQRLALDARGDDGRALQAGVYFVRVQGPDGARSRRFLVLR